MHTKFENFCKRLNIKYNEEALPYYESAFIMYNEQGLYPLDKDRLIKFNDQYCIFRKWFDDVLTSIDEIKKSEDLIIYIYALIAAIKADAQSALLPAPDHGTIATDYAPLFSLLYFLEDMIGDMESRGVPHDIISDTLNGFDTEINDYYDIHGRSGMRTYVSWFMIFVKKEILRIGRFQFQITNLNDKIRVYQKGDDVKVLIDGDSVHKKGMLFGSANQDDEEGKFFAEIVETDGSVIGYAANEFGECEAQKVTLTGYKEVLRAGDDIISVHIPSHAPLDAETSEKSYVMAKQIFSSCYGEHKFKAFACFSWMLEKRLKEIMGRDTNVTRFADQYIAYPLLSQGAAVYSFLYHLSDKVDAADLPENSSMQRAVKKYILNGNVFYEKGGIILWQCEK